MNLLQNLSIKPAHAGQSDIVGTIQTPVGVSGSIVQFNDFLSVIIVAITVVAGLFTLWQFLSGGLDYITAGGDKAKIQQASSKLTSSVIGLVIIAASFIIIAILGFLLFGSPAAFLSPTIKTL